MIVAGAFWLFLICVIVVTVTMGGSEGRLLVITCVTASALTYVANVQLGFDFARLVVLVIDVGVFAIIIAIALRSRSYWPIWFSAFQMITVATHFAQMTIPSSIPGIYGNAAGFWALPALGAAVVGVMLDRRAGVIQSQ